MLYPPHSIVNALSRTKTKHSDHILDERGNSAGGALNVRE